MQIIWKLYKINKIRELLELSFTDSSISTPINLLCDCIETINFMVGEFSGPDYTLGVLETTEGGRGLSLI